MLRGKSTKRGLFNNGPVTYYFGFGYGSDEIMRSTGIDTISGGNGVNEFMGKEMIPFMKCK